MDGIERIKVLASEIKNKAILKVIEHLLSREDMNEKYLNEEKSLKQMISYIRGEAKKQAEDGCAMLEDEEVYGLAIHYWDESNKELGIKSEKELKKEDAERRKYNKEQEEIIKQQKKEQRVSKKKEKQSFSDKEKIIEEPVKEEVISQKDDKPRWVAEGQLSLFDVY